MIIPFIYELRARQLPVGTQEAVALASALSLGLHESSLDGFYHVARALCVHSESHLDAFDEAFANHFRGIGRSALEIRKQIFEWLRETKGRLPELTDEETKLVDQLDPDTLRRLLEERPLEPKGRGDVGRKGRGVIGPSMFGKGGQAKKGARTAGQVEHRSAVALAGERHYRAYRTDLTIDTRQAGVALRKLRAFVREGAAEELDLEGTIDATAKNAGELDVRVRAPRRPNTRVILMMDVGGSMDPYADLVSRLFSAASKASHFKELRSYYFHNCVYGEVYKDAHFNERVRVDRLLHECGPHYKLVVVGDALMAPHELLSGEDFLSLKEGDRSAGLAWLDHLSRHFHRSCWLNPEPVGYWTGNTIEYVRRVFEMFPLTIDGLGQAVTHLTNGRQARRAA